MRTRSTLLALAALAFGAVISACANDATSALMAPDAPAYAIGDPDCTVDVTSPVLSAATASPNTLWPPNHKWWNVTVSYTATDNCGVPVCTLSVSSNEPVNGLGDGNTAPDWIVTSANSVQLRAERAGVGSGRVYTIGVRCVDASNNASSTSTVVTVVHDQGKRKG
jgi:hypothetical protein